MELVAVQSPPTLVPPQLFTPAVFYRPGIVKPDEPPPSEMPRFWDSISCYYHNPKRSSRFQSIHLSDSSKLVKYVRILGGDGYVEQILRCDKGFSARYWYDPKEDMATSSTFYITIPYGRAFDTDIIQKRFTKVHSSSGHISTTFNWTGADKNIKRQFDSAIPLDTFIIRIYDSRAREDVEGTPWQKGRREQIAFIIDLFQKEIQSQYAATKH